MCIRVNFSLQQKSMISPVLLFMSLKRSQKRCSAELRTNTEQSQHTASAQHHATRSWIKDIEPPPSGICRPPQSHDWTQRRCTCRGRDETPVNETPEVRWTHQTHTDEESHLRWAATISSYGGSSSCWHFSSGLDSCDTHTHTHVNNHASLSVTHTHTHTL